MAVTFTHDTRVPNFPELLDMDKRQMHGAHEANLRTKLNFIYYPTLNQLQRYHCVATARCRPPDEPSECVFVGQVPHLIPVEVVGWAIDLLLRNYSCLWMAKGRKTGCAKVWVPDRNSVENLLKFTRGLMFDIHGIWYVSTTSDKERSLQLAELDDYATRIKHGLVHVDVRLPKGPMVLELVGQPGNKSYAPRTPTLPQYYHPVIDEDDDETTV